MTTYSREKSIVIGCEHDCTWMAPRRQDTPRLNNLHRISYILPYITPLDILLCPISRLLKSCQLTFNGPCFRFERRTLYIPGAYPCYHKKRTPPFLLDQKSQIRPACCFMDSIALH